MDKEELDKIKAQADEITNGVLALSEQMKKYKSGAEFFDEAIEAIKGSTEREKEVVAEVQRYVETLSRTNLKKSTEMMGEILVKLENIKDEFNEIEKKTLAQQKEERKLEREIKGLREEMGEMRAMLVKNEEKKGLLGIFKRR